MAEEISKTERSLQQFDRKEHTGFTFGEFFALVSSECTAITEKPDLERAQRLGRILSFHDKPQIRRSAVFFHEELIEQAGEIENEVRRLRRQDGITELAETLKQAFEGLGESIENIDLLRLHEASRKLGSNAQNFLTPDHKTIRQTRLLSLLPNFVGHLNNFLAEYQVAWFVLPPIITKLDDALLSGAKRSVESLTPEITLLGGTANKA